MADEHEQEKARAAEAARDRAEAAYDAARFDGLCEEGAAEVAAEARRAWRSGADNDTQARNE